MVIPGLITALVQPEKVTNRIGPSGVEEIACC
jgi:hypothetical protein